MISTLDTKPLWTMLANIVCLAALLPFAAEAATVKGSGKVITESRKVGDFQAVSGEGSIDLVVRQGAAASVQVTADDNLAPLIETVVQNGRGGPTLVVRVKNNTSFSTRSKMQVEIVTPRLSGVATEGSGDVRVEGVSGLSFKLTLSGSGDALLDRIAADDLSITLAGSSDVKGSGKASRLAVSISGSGGVNVSDLRAEDVSVSIAGSGDASVHASKTLKVDIAGSGDVNYSGAAQVKSSIGGSGSVNKR